MDFDITEFFLTNKTIIFIIIIIIFVIIFIWYINRLSRPQSNWWHYQTVKFRPGETNIADGQIDTDPDHEEVPAPKNLYWDTKPPQLQEFTQFINNYFDQDTTYPPEYLNFILTYPNTNIILLRSTADNSIKATMILRPITITIRRRQITCHYIDLLCIHPGLRKQKLNEKMMGKLKRILNTKPNDICIFQIDKHPLPYEPTAKLTNYLLDLSASATTNQNQNQNQNQNHYLPRQNFELKTYNGEPELTKLLTTTSALEQAQSPPQSQIQLTQNFTPEEFKLYFTTDPTYRVSFYELIPNSTQPNFCAVYFLDAPSKNGRVAEIIKFHGPPKFLKDVIQKLKTFAITHINVLESSNLPPVSHLLPLGFKPSEPTFIQMYNYQTKEQIQPKEANFNQP